MNQENSPIFKDENGNILVGVTYQTIETHTDLCIMTPEEYSALHGYMGDTFFALEARIIKDVENYLPESICVDGVGY